jgi:site-specific DNA-methyltransferase (adenine-specific)
MGIKFDTRNYRKHSDENKQLINKSLSECGAGRSILIDANDEIIAGNGVYEQAQALNIPVKVIETDGSELVVVKRTDLDTDDERRKRLAVMDNSASDSSEFDLELLSMDFEVPDLQEMGIEIPDITVEEEKEVVEDEVPEEVETRCKRGDIWQLGEHRLMCGDSTSIDDVEKLMDGARADMAFTDPPYGVDYKGINNDSRGGLEELLDKAFSNMMLNSKNGASVYCFHSDKCADIFHNVFRKYCHFSSMIIWKKQSLVLSQTDYQSIHEPCMYGWFDNGNHCFYGDRKQTSVWEYDRKSIEGHTTPKPVDLIANALTNSSRNNDRVIDLFGGSGSTLIACEQLNRKCYTMELDEHYCDVIIQRWENLTGQRAELINENN